MSSTPNIPLLENAQNIGSDLGIDLWLQRDDLLPYPLAGNKVRKIIAELAQFDQVPDVLITTGGVDSNHCRTVAMEAARRGKRAHLVLHGKGPKTEKSLHMLRLLGATYEIVEVENVAGHLRHANEAISSAGESTYQIEGGGHTRRGANAYRQIGEIVLQQVKPDVVFVATGTGATHGGIVAAAQAVDPRIRVVGVSVGRTSKRAIQHVTMAAQWAGAFEPQVEVTDKYLAGGYGLYNQQTLNAMEYAWNHGLPVDPTYTGKCFAALIDQAKSGYISEQRVLFWHTGGLWNFLASD